MLSCVRHTTVNMKTKIIIIILFCLIVGVFFSGCASIGNAGVAGTYGGYSRDKPNNYSLVLNIDGTYDWTSVTSPGYNLAGYYSPGGQKVTQKGTYEVKGDTLMLRGGSFDIVYYKISGNKLLDYSGNTAFIKE